MSPYFSRLYAYNEWANGRVLEALEVLTEEEFTRDLGNSFPSIRDTLVHILGAEWIWLMRWRGSSPTSLLTDGLDDREAVRTRLKEVEQERREFLDGLSEEDLEGTIRYTNTKGEPFEYPLWQLLAHVVNHSTYHRGQIATMLRRLGHAPVSTDMVYFKEDA